MEIGFYFFKKLSDFGHFMRYYFENILPIYIFIN